MAQPVQKSSAKFVLVAMADCVNSKAQEMLCWPTIETLSNMTSQDRKTVIDNIKRLQEKEFIELTGSRKGVTGSVPVYRLCSTKNGTIDVPINSTEIGTAIHEEDAPIGPQGSTESGTAYEAEAVPKKGQHAHGSSTVFPMKQYRFSL